MPIYNYKCDSCDHKDKIIKRVSEFNPQDTEECPVCRETMSYALPTSVSSQSYNKNKYRGTSQKVGLTAELTKRMRVHDRKYEYKDRIDEFGLDNTKHIIDKVEKI